jgi:sugar/nucleoside kinase (ribokinase family)
MDAALFGLIVADVIASPLNLRRPPAPGGLTFLDAITLTTGGNVCNVGTAMARFGMHVAAAGMVGDDILGRACAQRLLTTGIDISAIQQTADAQTSATIVAVEPGGERCFFHTPGANALLDADAFRRSFAVFRECAWVQIGYFGLLPALTPQLAELLKELRAAAPGTKIALDTVNPPADAKLLWPILPHVDLFAPSRTEGEALTDKKRPATMAAMFRSHMRDDAIVGIKLDAEGCYLDDGKAVVKAPAYEVDVVDTTGAGDVWFAGLLTALRKKMPLEDAGKFANRAAADCCTALGASAGVKSFEETVARM